MRAHRDTSTSPSRRNGRTLRRAAFWRAGDVFGASTSLARPPRNPGIDRWLESTAPETARVRVSSLDDETN